MKSPLIEDIFISITGRNVTSFIFCAFNMLLFMQQRRTNSFLMFNILHLSMCHYTSILDVVLALADELLGCSLVL